MKFLSGMQLKSTLLISSALHLIVIAGIPGLRMATFDRPVSKAHEMTYMAITQMPKPQPAKIVQQPEAVGAKQYPALKKIARLQPPSGSAKPPLRGTLRLPVGQASQPKMEAVKKPEPKPIAAAFTDKPILNKLSESDILALRNSPLYRDYCQIIREAVREQATAYYNRFTEIGEVTVSFVLQSDGTLREVRIIEDASTENEYLRTIASQSVLNAGPYPAFPKGFPIRELIFKLPISFRGGRIGV